MAKLCGVAYHTAHRWKTGASSPRGGNLLKLIDLAGKSVKLLAGLALLLASALPFEKDATAGTGEVRPEFNRSIHYTQYHIFEL